MLRDSGVPVVLASAATSAAFAGHDVRLVRLDADRAAIAGQSTRAPVSGSTANSLVYVMYTSGSTGAPKGIAVVHYNVSRLVIGANYVDIKTSDVFLQLAPLSFDPATFRFRVRCSTARRWRSIPTTWSISRRSGGSSPTPVSPSCG